MTNKQLATRIYSDLTILIIRGNKDLEPCRENIKDFISNLKEMEESIDILDEKENSE